MAWDRLEGGMNEEARGRDIKSWMGSESEQVGTQRPGKKEWPGDGIDIQPAAFESWSIWGGKEGCLYKQIGQIGCPVQKAL